MTNERNSQQNKFTFRWGASIYVDWLLHKYSLVNSKPLALRITHYANRLNGQMNEKKKRRIDKPVKRCKVLKWKVRLFFATYEFHFWFRRINSVKAFGACITNAWKSSHLLFNFIQWIIFSRLIDTYLIVKKTEKMASVQFVPMNRYFDVCARVCFFLLIPWQSKILQNQFHICTVNLDFKKLCKPIIPFKAMCNVYIYIYRHNTASAA